MAQDINVIRKVFELKSKLFYPRLNSAFKSTLCFFDNDDRTIVAPVGSGVFIKLHESYYVVSAAHVLAEHHNDSFVMLDDKELVIGGRLVSTPMPPSGNRKDDKIDLSVLKVDDYSATELLRNFKPVEVSEIGINHQISDTATYFSVGFPLTRTEKVWGRNEIKSLGYTYQTEPVLGYNYEKFGFLKSTTIAFEYDGEVRSAKNPHPHLSPDITGVSGSGLWHFYDVNKKAIIGILIERIRETGHKAVLATKIDVVVKMIKQMG